jgi:hypothetical protein
VGHDADTGFVSCLGRGTYKKKYPSHKHFLVKATLLRINLFVKEKKRDKKDISFFFLSHF